MFSNHNFPPFGRVREGLSGRDLRFGGGVNFRLKVQTINANVDATLN